MTLPGLLFASKATGFRVLFGGSKGNFKENCMSKVVNYNWEEDYYFKVNIVQI